MTATAEDIDSISTAGPPSPTPGVVGAVFVPPADEQHLLIAARSLERAGIPFFAGGPFAPTLRQFADAGYRCLEASTAADLVNQVWAAHHLPVLAVGDAITLPDDFLTRALELLGDDLRIATVSFLSNDAALLSFPERNRPSARPPDGQDATSVTRLLRQRGPRTLPTPIPTAKGAAVLLAGSALGAAGGLVTTQAISLDYSIAEFSARGMGVAASSMYWTTPSSTPATAAPPPHPGLRRPSTTWTPRSVTTSISTTRWRSPTCTRRGPRTRRPWRSPSGWPWPRSAGCGSCGGRPSPRSTRDGHAGLHAGHDRRPPPSRRDQRGGGGDDRAHPGYAQDVLTSPKVRGQVLTPDALPSIGHVDVAHRMIQPDMGFSVAPWKQAADVVVLTFLDLIAYRVGSYHRTAEEWSRYRQAIRREQPRPTASP